MVARDTRRHNGHNRIHKVIEGNVSECYVTSRINACYVKSKMVLLRHRAIAMLAMDISCYVIALLLWRVIHDMMRRTQMLRAI